MARLWGGLVVLLSWSCNISVSIPRVPSTLASIHLCLGGYGIPTLLGRLSLLALCISKKDSWRDGRAILATFWPRAVTNVLTNSVSMSR